MSTQCKAKNRMVSKMTSCVITCYKSGNRGATVVWRNVSISCVFPHSHWWCLGNEIRPGKPVWERKQLFFSGMHFLVTELVVDSAGAEPRRTQGFLLFLRFWNIGRVSCFTLPRLQTQKDTQVCWEWWGGATGQNWDGEEGAESIKECLKKMWPVIQEVLQSQMAGRTWRRNVMFFPRDLLLQLG